MEQFGGNTNWDLSSSGTNYVSDPAPQKTGFSSWSGDFFNTIGTLGTGFFNSQAGYQTMPGGFGGGQFAAAYPQQRNPNTMLYVVGAIVLLVVLFVFAKKK